LQAAAEIAYAEVESQSWNFWLSPPASSPVNSSLPFDSSDKPSETELERFKTLYQSGVRRFVGPSHSGGESILNAIRSDQETYEDVTFISPFPLPSTAQKESNQLKALVPSWESHLQALLAKFVQYSGKPTVPGRILSIIPVAVAETADLPSMNATWHSIANATKLNRTRVKVNNPLLLLVGEEKLKTLLVEATQQLVVAHVVILDSQVVAGVEHLVNLLRQLPLQTQLHVHAINAMNFHGELADLLETSGV
jgi:hypothetical protein